MPKFVIEQPDDEQPLVVSVVEGDESGEIEVRFNDWIVGTFRDNVFELTDVRGLDDDLDAILDGNGYIKVRKEGETKVMK